MKVFKSKRKGAVILSRDTGSATVEVREAIDGLIKRRGCVMFCGGDRGILEQRLITKAGCIREYNDYPLGSTAWLVYPAEQGTYWWERIDDIIDFS